MTLFFAEKISVARLRICIVFIGKGLFSYWKNLPIGQKRVKFAVFRRQFFCMINIMAKKIWVPLMLWTNLFACLNYLILATNKCKKINHIIPSSYFKKILKKIHIWQFIRNFSLFGHFFNFLAENDHETGVFRKNNLYTLKLL